MQGTFRFLERGKKPFIKDWRKIESHLKALFEYKNRKELLNAGELSDSLIGEDLQPPASHRFANLFKEQDCYRLLLVTKSDRIENLLKIEPEKITVSFSINAKDVAKRWEKGAPLTEKRIDCAFKLYEHGYPIRIRIDPIVSIENWKEKYRELLNEIFKKVEPERITFGTLRGLSTTIRNAKDVSWVDYLDEKSNWGLKPRFALRKEIYEFMLGLLNEFGFRNVGICKETFGMFSALNFDYKNMACNCIF